MLVIFRVTYMFVRYLKGMGGIEQAERHQRRGE